MMPRPIKGVSRLSHLITLLATTLLISGCHYAAMTKTRQLCRDCSFIQVNTSNHFAIASWSNTPSEPSDEPLLHIYLEGDGNPWHRHRSPAMNPNSRSFTALKLMQLDSFTAVYVNRPCYGFDQIPDRCSAGIWTHGRYSQTVVTAISEALDTIKTRLNKSHLLLIGHSGGGSLAMLIAQQRSDVAGVVTIAANLDHRAWTDYFNYEPLFSSLNAANQPILASSIPRIHYIGDNDRQVPMAVTLSAVKNDPFAQVILKHGYDHQCCWTKTWGKDITDLHKKLLQNIPPMEKRRPEKRQRLSTEPN